MTVDTLRLVEVESFPRPMDAGVLYHSTRFSAAGHACACGCGREVITPLSPVQWRLSPSAGGPTLRPSIGNWNFPCRSHYWITNGSIEWSYDMSEEEIKAARSFNAQLRDRYFAEENAREETPVPLPPQQPQQPELPRGWIARLFDWFSGRDR